jgi:hypothetical protein
VIEVAPVFSLLSYCSTAVSVGTGLPDSASMNTNCPNGELAEGGEITMKMVLQLPAVKLQPAGITPVPVESIA